MGSQSDAVDSSAASAGSAGSAASAASAASAEADAEVADFVSERDLLVECQGELRVAEAELDHLRAALVSARRIGAAIGILMGTRRLTDDDAFSVLSQASQRQNRKLRLVAEDVIRTGTVD